MGAKVGRPLTSHDEEVRSEMLRIRLSPAERELIESVAGDEPVSTFVRDLLLELARA